MGKMFYNEYWPYYFSPPGESILEVIEYLGMSEAELASKMGMCTKVIHDLINGQEPLTPEMAHSLSQLFGASADFWNNCERLYRQSVARQEKEGPFEGLVGWLDEVPLTEMIQLGWIDEFDEYDGPSEQLIDVLHFFRVPSPGEWPKEWSYLKPQADALSTDLVALSAWLRQGEWSTREIDCEPYDERCFRQALQQIRALTTEPLEEVFEQVVTLCARSGVAVGMIPTLSGMNVYGVTRWLIPERALIQLAPSHNRPNELWGRFFHQVYRLFLHDKKEYFEGNQAQLTPEEREANQFAAQMLRLRRQARGRPPSVNGTEPRKERMASVLSVVS